MSANSSEVLTVRLEAKAHKRLASLAKATGRTKSFLAGEAINQYLALEAWQIAEIQQGLKEADAGDFATVPEVTALKKKWKVNAR